MAGRIVYLIFFFILPLFSIPFSSCVRYSTTLYNDDAPRTGDKGSIDDGKTTDVTRPIDATARDASKPEVPRIDVSDTMNKDMPGDTAKDASPPQVFFSEDFSAKSLSGWTVVEGSWSPANGYLEATSGFGGTAIQIPAAIDMINGTIQFDVSLPVLDCRSAALTLLDAAKTAVLSFDINFCVPWNGGHDAGLSIPNYASQRWTWTADTNWHNLVLKFSEGIYKLYYDDTLIITQNGPQQLKASFIQLGGWMHQNPGTRYDNIKISNP